MSSRPAQPDLAPKGAAPRRPLPEVIVDDGGGSRVAGVVPAGPDSNATARLARTIRRLGWLGLIAVALQVPLSFALTPFAPRGQNLPEEELVLSQFVSGLPLVGTGAKATLTHVVTGDSALRDPMLRAIAFGLPEIVATLAVLLALVALLRSAAAIDRTTVALLLRFAIAGAALRVLAYPICTSDFWFSVAWGRMLTEGANPYFDDFTAASLRGLPFGGFQLRMTYGPLWAWASLGVSALAARHVLAEFLLFKLMLAASWVATLLLVRRLAASRSQLHAAIAVCVFGWIPASAGLTIAEGHNDIVMVMLMTLWLYLLVQRRSLWSPLALTASVLIKYVTAPLIALELLHSLPTIRARPLRYLLIWGACLALTGLAFAPFLMAGNPLRATADMATWHFWTPGLAIVTAAARLGMPIGAGVAETVVRIACAVLMGHALMAYIRTRSRDDLVRVLLAVFVTILSVVVGHLWPWFLLWAMPLVALRWDCLPARLLLGALLAVPILSAHWVLARGWDAAPDVGLAFFGATAVFAIGLAVLQRHLTPGGAR